jgi:hypothetical protein
MECRWFAPHARGARRMPGESTRVHIFEKNRIFLFQLASQKGLKKHSRNSTAFLFLKIEIKGIAIIPIKLYNKK